jgi:hypothetical protein
MNAESESERERERESVPEVGSGARRRRRSARGEAPRSVGRGGGLLAGFSCFVRALLIMTGLRESVSKWGCGHERIVFEPAHVAAMADLTVQTAMDWTAKDSRRISPRARDQVGPWRRAEDARGRRELPGTKVEASPRSRRGRERELCRAVRARTSRCKRRM